MALCFSPTQCRPPSTTNTKRQPCALPATPSRAMSVGQHVAGNFMFRNPRVKPQRTGATRLPPCYAALTEQPPSSNVQEIAVTLKKPVGLVFCQKPSGGPVYVDEVTPGGQADQSGLVQAGDILARCSAVALKEDANTDYSHGQTPYKDLQRFEFDCLGQDFKTVMAALKSNNTRWGITDVKMVFQRPMQQGSPPAQ